MSPAGDDTGFFSKKVGKHFTTFFDDCGQSTCFSGAKLTHAHHLGMHFTFFCFLGLFPPVLAFKNVQSGKPRTLNYILSFEFPKENCSIQKSTTSHEGLRWEILIIRF